MTDNLFGDDLNKRMKEAELASKVASKNYGGMLWPTYILDVAFLTIIIDRYLNYPIVAIVMPVSFKMV